MRKCSDFYEQYGPDAIAAGDYCRAMNLMSFLLSGRLLHRAGALDTSWKSPGSCSPYLNPGMI